MCRLLRNLLLVVLVTVMNTGKQTAAFQSSQSMPTSRIRRLRNDTSSSSSSRHFAFQPIAKFQEWRGRRRAETDSHSSSPLIQKTIAKFKEWRERRREELEFHPISPLIQTQNWKKLQEELEEWEDEDFLSADIRPKELNHERDFHRVSTRVQAWDEYVRPSDEAICQCQYGMFYSC
jgi:hypothetical protein